MSKILIYYLSSDTGRSGEIRVCNWKLKCYVGMVWSLWSWELLEERAWLFHLCCYVDDLNAMQVVQCAHLQAI
jgi:hypothetical protein